MEVEIITRSELTAFKQELLSEIKSIIKPSGTTQKTWLKSVEVRKLLSISPGTLQNLRIKGTLRYTKIGGTMYYRYSDIVKLLEENGHD